MRLQVGLKFMPGNQLTNNQAEAVRASGNVLVMAGAGTGKTSTLVARCMDRLSDVHDPVSVSEMLVVTFTEAAAAELRLRLREEMANLNRERSALDPMAEQLALIDTAHISTLHSFCLNLVQNHFHELGLDAQWNVLDQGQADMLAGEALDEIFRAVYEGEDPASSDVLEQLLAHGGGEQKLRQWILRLHRYAQSLPDPAGWLENQRTAYETFNADATTRRLLCALREWREEWLPILQGCDNQVPAQCAALMAPLGSSSTRGEWSAALKGILPLNKAWPHGTKGKWESVFDPFFRDAAFYGSLVEGDVSGTDPLEEDWQRVQLPIRTLIEAVQRFGAQYAELKQRQSALDFADLEQYALRLLVDRVGGEGRPSAIAQRWRNQFKYVLVDEYQDINAAQDAIITALSRTEDESNRFLVGDVKQSIYRFRRAAPHIFQNYYRQWRKGKDKGCVIPLADNFRSHEKILAYVNGLFGTLMREDAGNVAYDDEARLRFGNPGGRSLLTISNDSWRGPRVEFQTLVKTEAANSGTVGGDEEGQEDRGDMEVEAAHVAHWLHTLRNGQFPVWDRRNNVFRPMEWSDAVILLRSPGPCADSFAREFHRSGIPLHVERGGFFEHAEITDLLSVLQLLDNPLQDVPLLAVLRSPIVGMTLGEMAELRIARRKGAFWTALAAFRRLDPTRLPNAAAESAWAKISRFWSALERWRELVREESLSLCLETVLDDTHYEAWLAAEPRADIRLANVRQLLLMTRAFDQMRRQGLFRFLQFVETQQDLNIETPTPSISAGNTVRLMSIHQSKGLEFPVVAVAGLGRQFNLHDLSEDIILDEELGICAKARHPHTGRKYPCLDWRLASRRQRRETLAEEMRLLYVAFTRACDRLLLMGTIKASKSESAPRQALSGPQILSARTPAEWLMMHLRAEGCDVTHDGESPTIAWKVIEAGKDLPVMQKTPESARERTPAADWEHVGEPVVWQYPFDPATRHAAKASVSVLRRRVVQDMGDEATICFQTGIFTPPRQRVNDADRVLTAAELGTAHHRFLELIDLTRECDEASLATQADALVASGYLTTAERQALHLEAVARLWALDLGGEIRRHAEHVHRELAFNARFRPDEIAHLMDKAPAEGNGFPWIASEEDHMVVQGVVDLAVILDREIWLLDYKTDRITPDGIRDKVRSYGPQLELYRLSLERTYRKPVTRMWLYFLTTGQAVLVSPLNTQTPVVGGSEVGKI